MTPQPAPIPIPPPAPKMGWRVVAARSADEARQGTPFILAFTSLCVWIIQDTVFHGSLPGAVSAALYIVIPTAIGYLATHVTIKKVTL